MISRKKFQLEGKLVIHLFGQVLKRNYKSIIDLSKNKEKGPLF